MPAAQHRYVVRFIGHVQGVCFRATCLSLAAGLSVNGFVRNEADGSVLLDVDGELSELKELLARIQHRMARNIDETVLDQRQPLGRSDGFHIAW
jgi:acylphosphatase